MTRFMMTLRQSIDFVLLCLEQMRGGELFVPKIPSARIVDVARVMAPEAQIEIIGIRPGEKLHEILIPEDEARHTLEFADYFIIQPDFPYWARGEHPQRDGGTPCPDGFSYISANNPQWLSDEGIRQLVEDFKKNYPGAKG
jgi:UDP-N-acetylglucosamine 4,6-dehydratase